MHVCCRIIAAELKTKQKGSSGDVLEPYRHLEIARQQTETVGNTKTVVPQLLKPQTTGFTFLLVSGLNR